MAAVSATQTEEQLRTAKKPTITPPASVRLPKLDDAASSSELSDLEDDEETGEIVPDHYYGGGKVPVFKPTMEQFRSFKKFIGKIDKYGMESGIVKVIPPKEWRDALPPLDDAVKTIKVKNPITQEIAGSQGTYRQANIEKQRSYNLPQWRQLCEGSDHQPPARRGERRRNQPIAEPKATRATARATPATPSTAKKGRGRRSKRSAKREEVATPSGDPEEPRPEETTADPPPTPLSPKSQVHEDDPATGSPRTPAAVKRELEDDEMMGDVESGSPSKTRGRQPKSVSSRRKHNRRAAADFIDEAAFKDFDYRIHNQDEYTPERCEELEKNYWKSITYNSPLYGADMPGSLFDDSTTSWNVAKLENLLDVLGQKVPGVNTAYLYLGMWKSTFAWHLEDVDLYSINYIHFGAPKQWYSISQEDARRFEAAMKNVWPADAKQCGQFLRHKTYLISPTLLQSQYNIRVNRLVHHEGEFVITFPYGYHSGYNLGYNCAESVNFATESWLEYGRVAKKCNCTEDSVWVDVYDIERKLRGEVSEYEETDDDRGDENEGDGDGASIVDAVDLPTPPASVEGKPSQAGRKRKRERQESGAKTTAVKRIRVRIKAPTKEPCVLCPNDTPWEQLLPTDVGNEAHRLCALYTPETFIQGAAGSEKVCNVANIDKARLDLKCNYCRSKRGACFQCSHGKCARAYHATCAAAAGVLADMREITVVGEDGKESTDVGIDFRCRYHRPKRAKNLDGDVLEESPAVLSFARLLQVGDVIQMQYFKGDIFAGAVVENRTSEQSVVVDILPRGHRVEVEYKWILVLDPADTHPLMPASSSMKQRPVQASSRPNKKAQTSVVRIGDQPAASDPFCDPAGTHVWSDFQTADIARNPDQVPIDVSKAETVWYYLGNHSTEAKAHYTEDPRKPRNNPAGNFLLRAKAVNPPPVVTSPQRRPYPASYPAHYPPTAHARLQNAAPCTGSQHSHQPSHSSQPPPKPEEPYQYRPKVTGFGKLGLNPEHARPGGATPTPTGDSGNDFKPPATPDMTPYPYQSFRAPPVAPMSHDACQQISASRPNSNCLPPQRPVTDTLQYQKLQQGAPTASMIAPAIAEKAPRLVDAVPEPKLASPAQIPSVTSQSSPPQLQAPKIIDAAPEPKPVSPAQTVSGTSQPCPSPPQVSKLIAAAPELKPVSPAQTLSGTSQPCAPLPQAPKVISAAPELKLASPAAILSGTSQPCPLPPPAPGPQVPVANMGHVVQRDPLGKFPYLVRNRGRCSPGPYLSPYSPYGGFTGAYIPLQLKPSHYQQQQQQRQQQWPPSLLAQALVQSSGQKRNFEAFYDDMRDAATTDPGPERTRQALESHLAPDGGRGNIDGEGHAQESLSIEGGG